MRVKIISDGTAYGTRIVNMETGELVEGVVSVRWQMDAKDNTASVDISFVKVPIEAEGEWKDA